MRCSNRMRSLAQLAFVQLAMLLLSTTCATEANPGSTNSSSSISSIPNSSGNSISTPTTSSSQPAVHPCLGWAPSCLSSSPEQPLFVMIGDSITSFGFNQGGWAEKLALRFNGAVGAINFGVEGATTRRVDEICDKVLQQLGTAADRVRLVTIGFGANDAVTPRAPKWHMPVANFTEHLSRMVGRLQQSGMHNVVLITPPPVGRRGDRNNTETKGYAEAVAALANTLGLPSVDIYSSIMQVDNWQTAALETDQLHLSPVGQQVVYDTIMQVLSNRTDLGLQQLEAAAAAHSLTAASSSSSSNRSSSPGAEESSAAMKFVLCAVLLLLFLKIITETRSNLVGRKTGGYFPSLLESKSAEGSTGVQGCLKA